ncbi:hypothetical protein [Amycolatopsis sp. CA-230715]|uniref:hypothetical protein n=1 Tax=Amycolatopsis sp. CA-230715 TaxID=2745196 RepID=UPI001C01B31B|nr:hypothetical protein [Amycolatopsis sp. CA-230715]QWF79094.1 hypothetical protein HUW46_02501 [Amycolatopsis sp. CA-230715]
MPIRTNRGRAAVYRRLWGWPLRSSKHLIAALVVFAVVVTAVGIAIPKLLGRQSTGAAAPAPEETTSSAPQVPGAPGGTVAPTTRLTAPLKTPTSAPPNHDGLNIAKAWAAAWVNHPQGMTIDQWLQNLKPYTTEEFLPQMATVDLANIAATKVTGEPVAKTSFTSSMDVEIATDKEKLTISVVRGEAGWRVASYDKAG